MDDITVTCDFPKLKMLVAELVAELCLKTRFSVFMIRILFMILHSPKRKKKMSRDYRSNLI